MDTPEIIDVLSPLVSGAAYEAGTSVDSPTMYVPVDRLVETCLALRDTPALRFNVLIEVTAADYLPRDPRFEVVYHLLSVSGRRRLRLKVRVGESGYVPTVQTVWPSA
ncbi:MAG: NADH-quinone oxidoreductase subunit C, partial [Acidobacteria bacterium]|nr:NADH-quinone oxidoreductase subunit C [Acidobacteriota bacterium]